MAEVAARKVKIGMTVLDGNGVPRKIIRVSAIERPKWLLYYDDTKPPIYRWEDDLMTVVEEPPMTTSDPRETEHVECDCVPDIGPSHCHLCGEIAGHPVPWSEAHPGGQPGDHDELLAEYGEFDIELHDISMLLDISGRLAAALRTEQSARQAAEDEINYLRGTVGGYQAAIRGSHRREDKYKAERDALQQRIDAVRGDMHLTQMTPNPNDPGAYVLGRDAETALIQSPTESKEPDQKLDPEPTTCREDVSGTVPGWAGEDQIDPCKCALPTGHEGKHLCRHDLPADYGIEAPHE